MADTLFQHYGGFAAVSRVVLDFYERVLDDDDVAYWFENVEMARLIDHQTKFISSLMGGPASYTDSQLQQIHAHLDVGHDDFDRVAGLLAETLADHDVKPADVDAIIAEFERRRTLVVKRPPSGVRSA